MKYRNISLRNGKYCDSYGFLKYDDSYKEMLDKCNISDETKNVIKIYSNMMDIDSQHQAYMVTFSDTSCIGGIIIDQKPLDNETILVEIEFDENTYEYENDISKLLNNIIESLKIYFYDKKTIDVKIKNNCDMSKLYYDGSYYQKSPYSKVYVFNNDGYNRLIPALIKEIKGTEQNLLAWKQNWTQDIRDTEYGMYLFDHFFDKEMIDRLKSGTLPIDEMFYKINKIEFNDIRSKNNERYIEFNSDGKIKLKKRSKNYIDGKYYSYDYNVCSSWFIFNDYSSLHKNIIVHDNGLWTEIRLADNINMKYFKDKGERLYTYIGPNINNSSVKVEIRTDINNNIKKCYVDFRTHKNGRKGKVNGTYALRIRKETNCYKLNFLSRSGDRYWSIFESLNELDSNLYSQTIHDDLTPELLDKLIIMLIEVVNRDANKIDRKNTYCPSEKIVSNMFNTYPYAINYLKELKGEIPLPHLSDIVEQFIKRQDYIIKNEDNNKIKQLKK